MAWDWVGGSAEKLCMHAPSSEYSLAAPSSTSFKLSSNSTFRSGLGWLVMVSW